MCFCFHVCIIFLSIMILFLYITVLYGFIHVFESLCVDIEILNVIDAFSWDLTSLTNNKCGFVQIT